MRPAAPCIHAGSGSRAHGAGEFELADSAQGLARRSWHPLQSLTKDEVSAALNTATGDVGEVLQLRGELAKSSMKQYEAMEHVGGRDGRGFLQFYGAGRTGRFASRLVQVQNLPRNYLPDLAEARGLMWTGDFDAVELLYGSVPNTLSQLIRTAFIPDEGHRFVVADFLRSRRG